MLSSFRSEDNKGAKHDEQLRSKIRAILKQYETLKEWSDLGQWLLKLIAILKSHPFTKIPKKRLLCKRLAQCLSSIWNKAIHENTLIVYDLLLKNISEKNLEYMDDLPLFSYGLFPFFEYASIQCKPMVLDIFRNYFYPLGQELVPCLGGIINSIIIGMEDTSEEQMKKVMESLDCASRAVGEKAFFGVLWVSILRSSRCRLGGYKYLMKRWKKQSEDMDSESDRMPNKSALVMNALLASLQDENALIKRAALDFMCQHVHEKLFSEVEYLILTEACLLLFIKLEHAVLRRVNNFLFGELEINAELPILPMIQEALRRILIEDQSEPLKIIQNLYMQHPELVSITLQEIGYQLVVYIFNKDSIEKASERLVESIASHSELVLRALFEILQKNVHDQKEDHIRESIQYIDYALNTLLVNQFAANAKPEENLELFNSRTHSLLQFLKRAVHGVTILDVQLVHQIHIMQSWLDMIQDCVNKIITRQQSSGTSADQSEMVEEYTSFYVELSKFAVQMKDDSLFGCFTTLLLEILQFQNNTIHNELPEWLTQLIDSSLHGSNIQSITSIDAIISILKGKSQAFQSLKVLITQHSLSGIKQIQEQDSLAEFILQDEPEQGENYVKLLFDRVYTLIDFHGQDHKIQELILYFAQNFPQVFISCIEQSLLQSDDLRRYQIFCRLTNSHYRRHQDQNSGVGVLLVLRYLEHPNPLLRHSSRTWLNESAPCFFRIVDPLLRRLQQNNPILNVPTLKALSLCFQTKEWFIDFLSKNLYGTKTYMTVLVEIILVFLKTDYQNKEIDSQINAVSAEFLEQLMSFISDQRVKILVMLQALPEVLGKLEHVVKLQDAVLQIQMLNLIKLLVQCTKETQGSLNTNDRLELIALYQSDTFFCTLIAGLKQSRVFLLKSRYLNTLVLTIYSLSDIIQPRILMEKVQFILANLLNLLKNHEFNQNVQVQKSRRLSHIEYKNFQKQYQQFNIDVADQTQQIKPLQASGENFEEIMSLSNAVSLIISYFFRFKDETQTIQHKQNVAGILVDIITFNIWKQPKQQIENRPQFTLFQETCQMILQQLPQILTSYLECWRVILPWQFLSTKGCLVFDYLNPLFVEFERCVKEQLTKQQEQYTDEDMIKQSILKIIQPCAYQFMAETVSAMIEIWMLNYSNNFYAEPRQNKQMNRLLELLISLQLPTDQFMNEFLKTSQVAGIMGYYQKRTTKKGIYFFHYEQACIENGVLFFLYQYLSCTIYRYAVAKTWIAFLQFSKILLNSRHVSTLCFLLEILHLMSWKFSPKEVLHEGGLRKELHTQLRQLLLTLSEMAAQQCKYMTISVQANERYSVTANDNLQLVVPFTPVIFELFQDYQKVIQKGENSEELRDCYNIQRQLFDPYRQKGLILLEDEYSLKCSIIALKTLKRLSYVTLINTYEAQRFERVTENTKEFMANILPLFNNKDQYIVIEAASELLHTLLKNSKDELPQELKKQVLEIFNGQDFFKISKQALKYWTEIIDWISEKGDLLLEYLGSNQNFLQGFAGLFTSKNSETVKKIKAFERVCFIIYSGGIDKYNSKLNDLIDALLIAIKDMKTQPPAIKVLIMFCIRILVLRLSEASLKQVFIKLWPAIISMMMQIFEAKENPHVLLSGLKLVELFSIQQLEEFYYYQWIFVFDYFGITIDLSKDQPKAVMSDYKYIPSIATQFDGQQYAVSYENHIYDDQKAISLIEKKRNLIIKDPQMTKEDEVRRQALFLCQYLIDINQQNLVAQPQQLESLLEREFIKLDDYIFNI